MRRQRRQWRHWPWGWVVLGLSLSAWACFAVMAFLASLLFLLLLFGLSLLGVMA